MLIPRPTSNPPRWASNTVIDPVTGVGNVIGPPEEKKNVGWNRAEPPARQWFNWFMRDAGAWLGYLAQQDTFAPVNTFNVGLGGVGALPDIGLCSGIIIATNAEDNEEYAIGFVLGGGTNPLAIFPIFSNVLGFGTITGENVEITGGVADVDLVVNSLLFPVQNLNIAE